MDRWKKVLWELLFPRTIWIFLLFNVSIGLVLYIFLGETYVEVVSYVFYALSAYTLTVVCARMPGHFNKVKKRIYANRYANRHLTDKDQIGKRVETEQERKLHGIHSYKVCGWLMLLLNMAISVIVIIVVFESQSDFFGSKENWHGKGTGIRVYVVGGDAYPVWCG